MRKTLINLTRFGDLLQTQPIIHALHQQGHLISLVCLENFAGAAMLLNKLEHIVALPGAHLLSSLEKDWRACLGELEQWLYTEQTKFPEALINLTPALSSRLLSRLLLPLGQPEGFSLDEFGFGRNSRPWAAYVQAVTLCRGCSPFNLVDGFRQMTDVGHIPPVYALKAPEQTTLETMRARLAEKTGVHALDTLVAFQLGASNDARRWPSSHFASLGRRLEQAGLTPVILGSSGEKELAARYFAAGGPGLDFCGETDLPQLAALLRLCRLLVSNDTGTMHLAAGLGVPLLGIFLATAQPWDTGPYQTGLCCLEPRLDCHPCAFSTVCPHQGRCRNQISAEAAAELILFWMKNGTWPKHSPAGLEARIWLTTRDRYGFMDLQSLSGDEESDRSVWIRLQRDFYRRFLDGLDGKTAMENDDTNINMTLSPEMTERVHAFLDTAASLLLLASEQGRLLQMRPSDNARKGLLATCERIAQHLDASPDFVPLAQLWRDMVQDFADNGDRLLSFFHTLRQHLNILSSKF